MRCAVSNISIAVCSAPVVAASLASNKLIKSLSQKAAEINKVVAGYAVSSVGGAEFSSYY
jgi:hypothetical protein